MWLIVLALLILVVVVAGWIANSVAATNQAQAAVEAARAAQMAAAAQAATASGNTVLVIAFAVMGSLALFAIGFLMFRVMRLQQQMQMAQLSGGQQPGKWNPGPNAQFQRQQPLLGSGDPAQMMLTMMAMQMMQQAQQNQQRNTPPAAIVPMIEQRQEQPNDSGSWGW